MLVNTQSRFVNLVKVQSNVPQAGFTLDAPRVAPKRIIYEPCVPESMQRPFTFEVLHGSFTAFFDENQRSLFRSRSYCFKFPLAFALNIVRRFCAERKIVVVAALSGRTKNGVQKVPTPRVLGSV